MGVLLGRKVLEHRHQLRGIVCSSELKQKTATLSKKAFVPSLESPTLDVKGIATMQAAPGFYSTTAENFCQSTGELELLEELRRKDAPCLAKKTGLDSICKASHTMVLTQKQTGEGSP
eukprot:6031762-Amphidinium_carterae.1